MSRLFNGVAIVEAVFNEFVRVADTEKRPYPWPTTMTDADVERAAVEPGVLAYRLLSDVYAWFGFNATEMPFVNREGQLPRIDQTQLR